MSRMQEEEMKEWKSLGKKTLEEDTRVIKIDIPNAKNVMVVFYGRENNLDDTKPNSNAQNSVSVNGSSVVNCSVTYVRPEGANFHTFIYAEVINGYLDGCIKPKGNTTQYGFSNVLADIDSIYSLGIVSNNYFKKGSWIETYYR